MADDIIGKSPMPCGGNPFCCFDFVDFGNLGFGIHDLALVMAC